MIWCPICDNSTAFVFKDKALLRTCMTCDHEFAAAESFVVVNEHMRDNTDLVDEAATRNAKYTVADPTIATIQKGCPSCKVDREIKIVRLGDTLKYIYTCTECLKVWRQ